MSYLRIRLEGTLKATSPTHIGTGETRPVDRAKKNSEDVAPESTEISMIARDCSGLPYLTGSAIRGVVRNYLLQLFRSLPGKIAREEDDSYYADVLAKAKARGKTQDDVYCEECSKASLLEKLFGTPLWAGKIEFWDASATSRIDGSCFKDKEWDDDRQCYLVHSVAIDPVTGAAEAHKLYTFEVAPAGLSYKVNIVGQGLDEQELGMLLFGLNGFNSSIYPLTIGAMSGRGFGQMTFKIDKLYVLEDNEDAIKGWADQANLHDHAGYHGLTEMSDTERGGLIDKFKQAFSEAIHQEEPS
jgi:CRISPR/Cas system CSM-associated protein Csm3 (group 7 of RAMP superfamily)